MDIDCHYSQEFVIPLLGWSTGPNTTTTRVLHIHQNTPIFQIGPRLKTRLGQFKYDCFICRKLWNRVWTLRKRSENRYKLALQHIFSIEVCYTLVSHCFYFYGLLYYASSAIKAIWMALFLTMFHHRHGGNKTVFLVECLVEGERERSTCVFAHLGRFGTNKDFVQIYLQLIPLFPPIV